MQPSFEALWPPHRTIIADEARQFVLRALHIESPLDTEGIGTVIAAHSGVDMKTDDIAEVAVDLVGRGHIRFARDGSDDYARLAFFD